MQLAAVGCQHPRDPIKFRKKPCFEDWYPTPKYTHKTPLRAMKPLERVLRGCLESERGKEGREGER